MLNLVTKWFKDRSEAKRLVEMDLEFAKNAARLHGVNLSEWRYLGRTVISYRDGGTNEITASATAFGFCGIDDTDRRQCVVVPHGRYGSFDHHTWVSEHAALWKIGERNLWEIASSEPSQWLREYMLDKHDELWSTDDNWWVKKNTQRKKNKLALVREEESGNNVVKLEFKKPLPSKDD